MLRSRAADCLGSVDVRVGVRGWRSVGDRCGEGVLRFKLQPDERTVGAQAGDGDMLHEPSRTLRTSGTSLLLVPRVRTKYGPESGLNLDQSQD
ncbi:hypothetical protein WMY93_031306 [Mugilogobius chulae]|uniref:Uncharacterized protein n=1 Tax=Mugilogobius chulae TaxID=88201 RepID=A0AAW0MGC9_9GOBI